MTFVVLRFLAHVAAAFGVFWLVAFGAHLVGIFEDPRIVEMAAWERVIIVLWGLAGIGWWQTWKATGG